MKKLRHIKEIIRKITLSFLSVSLLVVSVPIPLVAAEIGSDVKETNKNTSEEGYVFLSNLKWHYAKTGYGDVKINKNDAGGMISILINGEKIYSMNAIFAHASSTLVYDLRSFNYDTFTTYAGVDSSKGSNGTGVKFFVYGAKNDTYESITDKDWVQLESTQALKGNNDAAKITVALEDYKWLKLYADSNGDNSYDHSVWVDAMLYDSKIYSPKENPNVEWINTVETYDQELLPYTNAEILANKELKLKLLQRTLVSRIGYSMLQAYVNQDKSTYDFIYWLFNDGELMEKYLLGGTPEGDNYIQALNVFKELYEAHKEDLNDEEYGDVYEKMMMAISLTYSTDVNFWQTAEKPVEPVRTPSDALDRYEVIKNLLTTGYTYDDVSTYFEKDIFTNLEIEEMRWVVNNRISDIEVAWLNWYTQMTKAGKTPYNKDGYTNPYTYIYYASGWNYEDSEYYKENSTHCAEGVNQNKNNSPGYKRGVNCNEKYGLGYFDLETKPGSPLRLWTIWEEDGVCGSLAGTGSNIEMSYGRPSTLVSQPGHAAYFVSKETEWKGEKRREWQIGNAAAGWAASYKGERMMLNWGTRREGTWTDSNNGSYLLLAQRAVDDWDNYKKAFLYNLLGEVRTSFKDKIAAYEQAIKEQPYNLDAWYQLIQTYLNDPSKEDDDYFELAKRILVIFKEYPLPMYDLLKLIDAKIVHNSPAYAKLLNDTLNELKNVKDEDYFQASAIRDIAKYLLGIKANNDTATFSFDGENANKLMLLNKAAEEKIRFEYTLNYEYDAEHQRVSDTTEWTQVTDGETVVDLSDRIDELNVNDDIVVHLLVNDRNDVDNLFFIDLQPGNIPHNIYANSLENRVTGVTDSMEWYVLENFDDIVELFLDPDSVKWQKFKDAEPTVHDDKQTMVLVRDGYTAQRFPSEFVFLTFEPDEHNEETIYVPTSRLSVETSSDANETESKEKAIDGNAYSFWLSKKSNTEKPWIIVSTNRSIPLSKIDYVPRQDFNETGRITKAKIEISIDGKKWTTIADELSWANDDSTKSYTLTTPMNAKYVRIQALESVSGYASAAMINLYQTSVQDTIPVEDLTISYIKDGYTYNGSEHKPVLTVKDDETELIENTNYSVSYSNNISAGEATIELTGLGKYDGTIQKTFTIAKAEKPHNTPNAKMMVDATKEKLSDVELPEGWSWKNGDTPLVSGETITATAIYHDYDNYENVELEITITKARGYHPVITIQDNKEFLEFEFTGEEVKTLEEIKKMITITDEEDGTIDINDSTKVQVSSNINWQVEGTYQITIHVTDSDQNEVEYTLNVILVDKTTDSIELTEENFEIVVEDDNLFYTGDELSIPVIVRDKEHQNHELTQGIDYDIEFSELVNAGNHMVTITGKNIYQGTLTSSYIIQKATQPKEMVSLEMHVSHDTTRLEQINLPNEWQWKDESIELQEGENKVVIFFIGDINHERYETEVTVIREAASIPEEDKGKSPVISIENKEYHFNIHDEEVTLEYFKPFIQITDEEDGIIDIEDEAVKIESDLKWQLGTWLITVTVTDSHGNISQANIVIIIEEEKKINISDLQIEVEEDNFVYNGEEYTPKVTVYEDGKVLEENVDYTVSYDNNKNAGTATITITGIGKYVGIQILNFTIEKVGPKDMPKSNIEVSSNTKIAKEVELPEGWHWEDENIPLVEGKNTLTAIYDGDNNHIAMEVVVVVTKLAEEKTKPEQTKPSTSDNTSNQNSNSNTHTNTKPSSNTSKKPSNSSTTSDSNTSLNTNSNTNSNSDMDTSSNTNSNPEMNTSSNSSSNESTSTNSNTHINSNTSSDSHENSSESVNEQKSMEKKENPWFYLLGFATLGVGIITLVILLKNRLYANKKK